MLDVKKNAGKIKCAREIDSTASDICATFPQNMENEIQSKHKQHNKTKRQIMKRYTI